MNKKLLIIGFVWPEPNSSAAGSRMMQLIAAFLDYGYQITFVSAAAKSEHAVDLKSFSVDSKQIKINHSSFNEFILKLQPDIVLFDRFMTEEQFGWRVAEECPNAMRILDTEDLHSLRKVRQTCFKNSQEFSINAWLQANITKREIASIYRSDMSLIISEYEMQLLKNELNISGNLLHYLPFMLDEISGIATLLKFEERQHFVTIGNFRHAPNYDSVVYLKQRIWPLIQKQLPKAKIHIYGSYPQEKVTQLHNEQEGFLIKGWADNVDKVMQDAKVCLAPLRFGAGLKGKFIDAAKNGTPSITTSIGAEGLETHFGGCIEEDPENIAQKAIDLYNNKTIWKEKQELGFKLIQRFHKEALHKMLFQKINATTSQLHNLRLHNFTGSLLQHNMLQSTKYMSKWIEEKNRK